MLSRPSLRVLKNCSSSARTSARSRARYPATRLKCVKTSPEKLLERQVTTMSSPRSSMPMLFFR